MTNEIILQEMKYCGPAKRQGFMQLLYNNNLSMIKNVANKFSEYAEYEDLMQEAYIILCEAVERYDMQSGYKFLTYYTNLLKWGFMEYCSRNSTDMYFTPHMIEMMGKYTKLKREHRDISDIDMCYMLGINEEQLKNIRNALYIKHAKRYYEPIGGEYEELLLVDTIEDKTDYCEGVEHALEIQRLHEVLDGGISKLEPWQAEIIQKLYYEEKTVEEIAEETQVDISAVRWERRNALKKLRKDRGIWKYYCQQMHPDAVYYNLGIKKLSVASFMREHESSVEKAVFRLMNGNI